MRADGLVALLLVGYLPGKWIALGDLLQPAQPPQVVDLTPGYGNLWGLPQGGFVPGTGDRLKSSPVWGPVR